MATTIKELALHCGVSEGTVDRALNDRTGISLSTKSRILAAADELGYKPNRIAQSLATGRTRTIGIISFDLINNCFTRLVDAIEAEAKSRGYFINLILTHKDPAYELEGLRYLAERRVDGIGLLPLGKDEQYAAFLKDLGIPIVTIFNRISEDFMHVGIDDRKIIYEAVQFIASKGYEQVVLVQPRLSAMLERGLNAHTICQRKLGYEQGLAAAGLNQSPIIAEGKNYAKSFAGIDFSRRTALLCISDAYAMAVMKHLRESGLSIPGDVGVMGFDSVDTQQVMHPLLTTVEYHVEAMGRQIVDNLCDMIEGKRAEHTHIMSYSIIEGETI